jgi:hypothetical protein
MVLIDNLVGLYVSNEYVSESTLEKIFVTDGICKLICYNSNWYYRFWDRWVRLSDRRCVYFTIYPPISTMLIVMRKR